MSNWLTYAEDVHLALAKIQGGLAHMSVTGKTFWVDNSSEFAADTTGNGTRFEPFLTIDYAIGQCVSLRGDVVLVLPNHDETITADGGIDLDVAGTSVVGLGWHTFRPIVRLGTNTDASVHMPAAGVRIQNMRFENTVAGLDRFIYSSGNGSQIIDCEFYISAADKYVANAVHLDPGNQDLSIYRCNFWFTGVSTQCDSAIYFEGASTRARIENCYISGDFSVSCIDHNTAASVDIRIRNNEMRNDQTTNIDGIIDLFDNTSTGVISWNVGWHGYAATDPALDSAIDAAICGLCENYFTNSVNEAGGLTYKVGIST